MEPPVPGRFALRLMAVAVAAALAGQQAAEAPATNKASGGLVVQVASGGIERVRIAHPLHGWSTTVPVVPGQSIRLEGLYPGDYVVEGWVTGIVAGKSVTVAAGAPAVVELKECWVPPDPPEEGDERVSRRYPFELPRDRSVRPRSQEHDDQQREGSTQGRASRGGKPAAPALGSTVEDFEAWVLENCSTCVLLSAFDAASGAPIPRVELRDEDRSRLFGPDVTEVETPFPLPAMSFDPVVWAWRPWSVWWVRAPGYAWQRVTIDHSAGGSVAIGLVRVGTPP